jgi:ATP-dependent Clp protease ATP-binding subunit ClpB
MTQIVHLAITRLIEHLEQRGITLKETPEFAEYLKRVGTSSKFGAREINRVITKEVESKIAQALVLGDLFEGDTISFTVVSDALEIQKYT